MTQFENGPAGTGLRSEALQPKRVGSTQTPCTGEGLWFLFVSFCLFVAFNKLLLYSDYVQTYIYLEM